MNEMKIAIVDDEAHIRALLEQTLEDLEDDHGVEVFSAPDGEQGLDMIRDERPQLVFLDVMMPRMSGYELCRAVTGDSSLSGVNIVLLTAKGQEVDRTQGLDAGAMRYMTKPFDPDEVVEVAREVLGL